MKKTFSKIGAIVLAVLMLTALGATAFAANELVAYSSTNELDSAQFTVKLTPSAGVSVPAYIFKYTVEAGEAAAATSSSPKVNAGLGSITIDDVEFTAAGDAEKTATIDLSAAGPFTAAGIYRYKITQAAITGDAADAGIRNEDNTTDAVEKTLDLYVSKDGKILAVIMSEDTALTTNGSNVTVDTKVDSFDNTFAETNVDNSKHTITLKKEISGNMADATEAFPFEVKVTSDNEALQGVKFTIGDSDTPNVTIGDTYTDIALKGGDSITIVVPNDVSVQVKETVDSGEGYAIAYETEGFDEDKSAEQGNGVADAGFTVTLDNATETQTITYTNTLDEISPTGVILRVAPFAGMMGGGFALLGLTRRSTRKDEDEDEIR